MPIGIRHMGSRSFCPNQTDPSGQHQTDRQVSGYRRRRGARHAAY